MKNSYFLITLVIVMLMIASFIFPYGDSKLIQQNSPKPSPTLIPRPTYVDKQKGSEIDETQKKSQKSQTRTSKRISNSTLERSSKNQITYSVESLKSEIANRNYDSILEVGKSGNKKLVPYLKKLANSNQGIISSKAQMALARLGEKKYLLQILSEIDNSDPLIFNRAFEKLAYVGGKTAFRKFHQVIDDNTVIETKSCKSCKQLRKRCEQGIEMDKSICPKNCHYMCDQPTYTRSALTIYYLSKMVDKEPISIYQRKAKESDIVKWKLWLEKNKHVFNY